MTDAPRTSEITKEKNKKIHLNVKKIENIIIILNWRVVTLLCSKSRSVRKTVPGVRAG